MDDELVRLRAFAQAVVKDAVEYPLFESSDFLELALEHGLMDELAKGRESLPMNNGCGNPCKNSPKCQGFNYGKEGGCPGYCVDDDAAAIRARGNHEPI